MIKRCLASLTPNTESTFFVNQGRGDALLGKVLLCESEGLSWDPPDQHKKPGTCNPGTRAGDKQVPRSSLACQ